MHYSSQRILICRMNYSENYSEILAHINNIESNTYDMYRIIYIEMNTYHIYLITIVNMTLLSHPPFNKLWLIWNQYHRPTRIKPYQGQQGGIASPAPEISHLSM